MTKNKITKDTVLAQALKVKDAAKILTKHQVPCVTCPMAAMEMDKLKLGQIAEMYGIDLKALLKDLNGKM